MQMHAYAQASYACSLVSSSGVARRRITSIYNATAVPFRHRLKPQRKQHYQAHLGAVMDCVALATRKSFGSYIRLLFDQTDGDLTRLRQCKPQVCIALWGQGNSDISGIGVSGAGSMPSD